MSDARNLPLIVTPYSEFIVGGIGTWTNNMIEFSRTDKGEGLFNIHIYANNLLKETDTRNFTRIITGLILYSKLIFQVLQYIIRQKPLLLHVTSSASIGLFKDLVIIWISRLFKTPVVMHWRFGRISLLADEGNWEWKMLCRVIRKSSFSIVIDRKSYYALQKSGITNVENIPNPIGLNVEQKCKIILDQEIERQSGRILFVGQIIKNKGVYELVNACSQINDIKELILIGPYEESTGKELMQTASIKEGGKWLKLTGTQSFEQVLSTMQISPILVLPSYTEGFPNVILEAMAMGCSIVATDVGAIPEMLGISSESPCGICVPAYDTIRLKKAIVDLINDPARVKAMGRNASLRVLNNYTIDKVFKQYKTVWNAVGMQSLKN